MECLGSSLLTAAWSRDQSIQGCLLVHVHVCPSSPARSVLQLFSPSTPFPGLNSSSDHVPAVPNTPLLISYQVRASVGCSWWHPSAGAALLTFTPSEGVRQEAQTGTGPCPFPEVCCISQRGACSELWALRTLLSAVGTALGVKLGQVPAQGRLGRVQ